VNKFLIPLFFGLVPVAGTRAADATNEVAPPPPYRYLFVIDMSAAMARQKATTIDTVHKLILSGIDGRIQPGETLGIWTFNETISTNGFRAQRWNPQTRQDLANRIYRFLRDLKFAKKAHLEEVLAAVQDTAEVSGTLTVFLFADGTTPLSGTPFDGAINDIFKNHAVRMRKAKKPFVVVFVAQEGRLTAHAVSPAGSPIYVPPVKKLSHVALSTPKPGQAQPAPGRQKPLSEPGQPRQPIPIPAVQTATTNVAKTLSVDEISAELARQAAQKRSNSVPGVPARPVLPGQTNTAPSESALTSPAAVAEFAQPAVLTSAPLGTATPPNREKASSIANAAQPKSDEPAAVPAPTAKDVASPGSPGEGSRTDSSAAITKPAGPSPPSLTGIPTNSDGLAEAEPTSTLALPPPPQAAVVVPSHTGSSPRTYLLIGVALLLVAVLLGWLFFQNTRSTAQPSLISRSMDNKEE